MGKKSLKIKVDNLSEENYIDVAHAVAKVVKSAAPESRVSILGAAPEVFEGQPKAKVEGS